MQAKLSEGKVIYKENMFPFTKNKKKITKCTLILHHGIVFFTGRKQGNSSRNLQIELS